MTIHKSDEKRSSRLWVWGIAGSGALLIVFMMLEQHGAKMLALEAKWLVVAGIPLLVAILRSNLIARFKGFGVELETRLRDTVGSLTLSAATALADLPGDEKQNMMYLQSMRESEREEIEKLTIREGRPGYYQAGAMMATLNELHKLRYIEVLSSSGKFVALIPVGSLKSGGFFDRQKLDDLIGYAARKEMRQIMVEGVITETIQLDEKLVEVLPKLRKCKEGELPVLTRNGISIGLISAALIERRIADEVMKRVEDQ